MLRFTAIFIDTREAVAADVRDFRTDVEQERLDALERRRAGPPTMIDSSPRWSVTTLPDTGASTISAPRAGHLAGDLAARVGVDRAHVHEGACQAAARR